MCTPHKVHWFGVGGVANRAINNDWVRSVVFADFANTTASINFWSMGLSLLRGTRAASGEFSATHFCWSLRQKMEPSLPFVSLASLDLASQREARVFSSRSTCVSVSRRSSCRRRAKDGSFVGRSLAGALARASPSSAPSHRVVIVSPRGHVFPWRPGEARRGACALAN